MTVLHMPDPAQLRAGMAALRQYAQAHHAPVHALQRAVQVLLREMMAGRSTAAAVARAPGAG